MANIEIEVGKTDGFHYLGVQPPSAAEGIDIDSLELPDGAYITSTGIDRPKQGEPYFYVGYDSGFIPPSRENEAAIETAKKLARLVFESTGDQVDIRPDVKFIGWGRYLFGGLGDEQL